MVVETIGYSISFITNGPPAVHTAKLIKDNWAHVPIALIALSMVAS